MELAITMFCAMLAFTFGHMALSRAFGARDSENTIWVALGVGVVLAATTVFGGAAFVPLPLCFLVFLLVHHFDLTIGRSVAVIGLLGLLALGVSLGLEPLLAAAFAAPTALD